MLSGLMSACQLLFSAKYALTSQPHLPVKFSGDPFPLLLERMNIFDGSCSRKYFFPKLADFGGQNWWQMASIKKKLV